MIRLRDLALWPLLLLAFVLYGALYIMWEAVGRVAVYLSHAVDPERQSRWPRDM